MRGLGNCRGKNTAAIGLGGDTRGDRSAPSRGRPQSGALAARHAAIADAVVQDAVLRAITHFQSYRGGCSEGLVPADRPQRRLQRDSAALCKSAEVPFDDSTDPDGRALDFPDPAPDPEGRLHGGTCNSSRRGPRFPSRTVPAFKPGSNTSSAFLQANAKASKQTAESAIGRKRSSGIGREQDGERCSRDAHKVCARCESRNFCTTFQRSVDQKLIRSQNAGANRARPVSAAPRP